MIDLHEYKDLPDGAKVTLECCKRGKKTAVVFSSGNKRTFYCSRCGESYSRTVTGLRNPWFRNSMQEQERTKTAQITPPDTENIPSDIADKLLVKEIVLRGYKPWMRPLLRYSRQYNRLVLPIKDLDRNIIGSQLRSLDGSQPKYLTTGNTFHGCSVQVVSALRGYGHSTVVFTEDILSSMAVGYSCAGVFGVALLGTHPSIEDMLALVRNIAVYSSIPITDLDILIWLDPDKPGIAGSIELQTKLSLLGLHSTRVVSSDDPKMLHMSAIINTINSIRSTQADARPDVITCLETPTRVQ